MVNRFLSLVVCSFLAAATVAFAQSSYIFQMPGQAGLTAQIVGLGDNDFNRHVAGTGPAGSTRVVATPGGSKFYILAPGGVYAANAALSAISPLTAITGSTSAAEVTPDGKYLLVISDHFYIVKTADDSLAAVADTGVPTGSTPISASVSHDAKTAWVLANTSTGSAVTAVNLATLEIAGSPLNLPSTAASMALSARGLLYVPTTGDRIYEIDPVTMAVTTNGQMQVPSGSAGALQFTPDGSTAYFLNRTSNCSTCPPIFKLDVQAHSVSGWLPSDGSTPPAIDQILVAGNNRVFGYTASSTQLWDIATSPLGLSASVLGTLPTSSVVALAVSDERPSARFLYVLVSDHNFYRVNLANNGIDGVSSLDPANGTILSFASIPAQSGATNIFLINQIQPVVPGGTTVLIGQFLDPAGRPVFGVPASFSADPAVTIATPSPVTTAGGWAQTAVTAPAVSNTYPVSLSGSSLSASFQLVVGAGTPSGNSLMSLYAGDGQLLRQNESTLETLQPLTVKVTDSDGNPLANVPVAFSVTDGIGSVFPSSVTTGTDGLASTNYTTAVLQLNAPFLLSKVTATSVYGSVEFYETTQDALVNDPHQPNSLIVTPANLKLTIPQGGFLPGGITVSTLSGHTGQGIPNVGLRITDPVDETKPSTVLACHGLTRGDNNGLSRCDVQAFCQPTVTPPHDFVVHIRVGEYKSYGMTVTVTNGTATVLNIVSGNNQIGHPSDSFTLAAQVTDGCTQPSAVSGLVWSIIQGSASFSSAQTASDLAGNVSARVTLGATAGPVRVQLTGPGLTPIVFTLTTQITAAVISLVSGGGQSVVVGQAFPNPVVFSIRDQNNNPVSGVTVNFSVSAGASINPASASTSAQGLVQTSVTAGSAAGTIVVTATSSPFTATATLSAHIAGPDLTSGSFTNAGSGSGGMTPCGLVTVSGSGVASAVQGVVQGVSFFGSLPSILAGLSISVQQGANNIPVPIQSVANDQSGQRATFQAPCELTPGFATVVVTVNGVSSNPVNVQVAALQPGIFTVPSSNGKQYATVIHAADGTYVTPANPAQRGEKCYIVVTGLGQVTPAAVTNSAGTVAVQNTNVPMLIFLNGNAVAAVSSRYLFGSIGSYVVEFQIPADAAIGPDQSLLVVGLINNGNDFVVGNTVLLAGVIANDTGGGGTGGGGTGGGGTGGGGTGGGGTGGGGTGGGGTGGGGTGGGGTVTGGATTPTQDEINSWIARGNFTSGQLSLTRSTTFTTTDNPLGTPTTSSTKTDSFSGQFTKTSGADLSKLLNNQLPAGFPVLSPAVGSCSVYSIASLTNRFPNLTTVNLDAGAQLTSNGPNGTQLALRQNTQGVGFTYNATNVPNTYLAAGSYALSGPGGADIGVFNGNLDTVADLVVTNPDNFKVINRSGGITVNWTGGEQSNILTISGSSFTLNLQTQSVSGNAFVCIQNVSAGQFTVPASILTQLAASPVTTLAGISTVTRGTLSVTASGKGARFTAPSGVDILTANNSWVWTFTPQYQ